MNTLIKQLTKEQAEETLGIKKRIAETIKNDYYQKSITELLESIEGKDTKTIKKKKKKKKENKGQVPNENLFMESSNNIEIEERDLDKDMENKIHSENKKPTQNDNNKSMHTGKQTKEVISFLDNSIQAENIKRTEKLLIILLHAAIFELLYKPQTSVNIIINEYLNAAEAFVDNKQKKFLNALLDKISKKIRNSNE